LCAQLTHDLFAMAKFLFFFLFFVFFAKATGRTVRPIWTNEGSKRVVPRKEVPFGDMNDVPINSGVKPPTTEIWGRE